MARARTALTALPRVTIASPRELRPWLATHHRRSPGAWVVTFKKGRGPHQWRP